MRGNVGICQYKASLVPGTFSFPHRNAFIYFQSNMLTRQTYSEHLPRTCTVADNVEMGIGQSLTS